MRRRIKLGIIGAAVAATAGAGLLVAPAAEATTVIGTPPGALLSLCLTIRPATSPALCIYI